MKYIYRPTLLLKAELSWPDEQFSPVPVLIGTEKSPKLEAKIVLVATIFD